MEVKSPDNGPGIEVTATCAQIGMDCILKGAFTNITIKRTRIGGKLDLKNTIISDLDGSGMRVDGIALMPKEIQGNLKLRAASMSSGLTFDNTRLHATLINFKMKLASIDLEDAAIKGDLKISSLQRVPSNGLAMTDTEPSQYSEHNHSDYLSTIKVYTRTLSCYSDGMIVELHRQLNNPARVEIAALLTSTDLKRFEPLNGASSAIFSASETLGLKIKTAAQAADYLRLFCSYVWGELGPFLVIETSSPPPWLKLPEGALLDKLNLAPTENNGAWECSAYILYGSTIYLSKFRIQDSGAIEMLNDEEMVQLKSKPFEFTAARRTYTPEEEFPAKEPWFLLSAPWKEEPTSILNKITENANQPILVRLGGCNCDTLDDNNGDAWGKGVTADLVGFNYHYLGENKNDQPSKKNMDAAKTLAPEFERQGGKHPKTFGRDLAHTRINWLKRISDPDNPRFNPQPYEQLVHALSRRGDNEAAREVMLNRARKENSDIASDRPLYASAMKLLVDIPFQYGLFWRNAFITAIAYLLIGTFAFDTANYAALRPLPIGSPFDGPKWNRGVVIMEKPALVINSRPVSDVAIQLNGRDVPATQRSISNSSATQELACGDQVESLIFTLDMMIPMLNLQQEDRCAISGRPGALVWRVFSMIYSIFGAYITSMLILTISGVLKRSVER